MEVQKGLCDGDGDAADSGAKESDMTESEANPQAAPYPFSISDQEYSPSLGPPGLLEEDEVGDPKKVADAEEVRSQFDVSHDVADVAVANSPVEPGTQMDVADVESEHGKHLDVQMMEEYSQQQQPLENQLQTVESPNPVEVEAPSSSKAKTPATTAPPLVCLSRGMKRPDPARYDQSSASSRRKTSVWDESTVWVHNHAIIKREDR